MKMPSFVVGLLFAIALAGLEALVQYFSAGPGTSYALAALITVAGATVIRFVQEKQKEYDPSIMMRSAVVEKHEPVKEALIG